MNTFAKLLMATALLSSTSLAALAQSDVGAEASGGVSVEAGGNGVGVGVGGNTNAGGKASGEDNSANASANANAMGQGNINYGSIISELRTSAVTAADIETIDASVDVQIVTLAEIRGNAAENANALDEAVASLESSVDDLRSSIEANADLSAALEAEGYVAEDVVAISSSADGSVTIIVDDAA